MKLRVRDFKKKMGDKIYSNPWIGYAYRNSAGRPDFKRLFSLVGQPEEIIRQFDRGLQLGGSEVPGISSLKFIDGLAIGATWVVWRIMEGLGIPSALSNLSEARRHAILAMILDRVLNPKPYSRHALISRLPGSAISRIVSPTGMELQEHDLYLALEDLVDQQLPIQKQLSSFDSLFLYDITSSYFEGVKCPLAKFGYNRDKKKGKKQIVVGLITNSRGRPQAISVFDGNTPDQNTVMGQLDTLRKDYECDDIVFVGDRGMFTSARREDVKKDEYQHVRYISALPRLEFMKLALNEGTLDIERFKTDQLVEFPSDGLRYIVSYNPQKLDDDRAIRKRLIERAQETLDAIKKSVDSGHLKSEKAIAKRLYSHYEKWKIGKLFDIQYGESVFEYALNTERLQRFEKLDGFYCVVTSVASDAMDTASIRATYRSLQKVERAFRTMKTDDLNMRPIRHWNEKRVRGHVFLCMLAYLVIWKARELFKPDENEPDPRLSLRGTWDLLDKVKIGSFTVNGKTYEQLNDISPEIKSLMRAAAANLDKSAKTYLRIQSEL